jgi:ribose transport system substrate-binding protein
MLHALKDAGLLGKVKFVGFDASPDLDTALAANQIQGLVVQNPYKMGYTGVATAVQVLQGQHPEAKIDTGAAMITPDNMNTPDMQKLLHPPVE